MIKAGKKRIGLILASIHTGSAQNVWSSFAREAAAEDAALFVFPGGELNSPTDLEYLRNPIFSLVNPHNLDGLISWSSTLGNTISPEEFRGFHEAFESLPYLTIAHKVPGHPCVQFDAYMGMKNLVSHFIHTHGARKIAFLRGPEAHVSAIDRFRGYRDALTEAGLAYDEALVTDPAGWARGAAACVQLVETRGLLPGRDFDTLIGSSDMMALPAIQYLSKSGYVTPGDYRAGGFNNSIESRILSNPLSTVHMPYAELSGESFKILKRLFETRSEGSPLAPQPSSKSEGSPLDVILPCEVIIRESCGCPGEQPALMGETVESLIRTLKEQEHSYTYGQYQREAWHTALNSLKCELLGTRDRKSLIQSLARHLPKIGIFTAAVMLYEDGDLSECVGNFFPGGLNIEGKRQFPADHLFPAEMEGQYAGGVFMVQPLFIENRSLGYFIHNIPFYDGVILEELRSTISNAFKGIFLFEETDRAKQIAEQAERAKTEFFAAIGNNLYDPFTELIDSIDDFEKSLSPIDGGGTTDSRSSPQAFQQQIAHLRSLAELRQERINHLIDLSLSQIDEISFSQDLFNITDILPELVPQGPFPLLAADKTRFQDTIALIREVYDGGLTAKMRLRGLELHFDGPAALSLTAAVRGERIAAPEAKHALQLAERIILIHKGELIRDEKGCSVLIPWPAYTSRTSGPSSEPSSHKRVSDSPAADKYLLAFSPLPIDACDLFGLPFIGSLEKALACPERIALILWDAGDNNSRTGPGAGEGEAGAWAGGAGSCTADALAAYKKVAALRSQAAFFHTPFLCFGTGLVGETLSAAVDAKLQSEKTGTILFIGIDGDTFPLWIDREQRVHIHSVADLADAVANAPPGLIVIGAIDEAMETIEAIRRHPVTARTAVILTPECIKNPETVEQLCRYPRVVLCHRSVAKLGEFSGRVRAIAAGEPILPLYTGALVKKTLLYFDQYAKSHISRWKLADSVNVSEDYLTRIFRREMGCSLWEYLNQYRVCLAVELLTHTGDTISEIAARTGFQDQAYFCRVFKKIYGKAPGQLREGSDYGLRGRGAKGTDCGVVLKKTEKSNKPPV
jgi:DNA-binding LacI/PurR family transcriptional regulator/AraC-like DNA-binding protein